MSPRTVLILVAAAGAVASAALAARQRSLRAEVAGLVAASESASDAAATARLAVEVDRIRLALERARSLSARTADAHLSLSLGDGHLTLERGEIVLRETTVDADVPRGVHRVEAVEEKRIALSGGITLVPAGAADTSAAPPLTIRVRRLDFDAIRPNLRAGLMAYFF